MAVAPFPVRWPDAVFALNRFAIRPERVASSCGLQSHPSHSRNGMIGMWWCYVGLRIAYTILTYQCCSRIYLRMIRPWKWDIIGHENIAKRAFLKARLISVAALILSIFVGAHS